jgi:RNA-directed DNA polymerase
MTIHYRSVPFERFADDIVCHCQSKREAESLKIQVSNRLESCGLKLNEEKTQIVCSNPKKQDKKAVAVGFDYPGYTFRPRKAVRKNGSVFTGFLPAIGRKGKLHIRSQIKEWKLSSKTCLTISEVAARIELQVRGWINYYGKYYASSLKSFLQEINRGIARMVSGS